MIARAVTSAFHRGPPCPHRAPRVDHRRKLSSNNLLVARAASAEAVAPIDTTAIAPVEADAELQPMDPSEPLEARAVLRFVRGSPDKMRRVLDVIRGCTYEDALKVLTFLPYRAAEPILKLLLSAGANAKNNLGMRKSRLYISECYCDPGPIMKRFRPRAQGRACKIQKKTSHIVIKVAERV